MKKDRLIFAKSVKNLRNESAIKTLNSYTKNAKKSSFCSP